MEAMRAIFPLVVLGWAGLAAAGAQQAVPLATEVLTPSAVRLAIDVRGQTLELEVRDLPRASARLAIEEALHQAYELVALADPDGPYPGGFGDANRRAGKGEIELDPRAYRMLVRGLQFCVWSNGSYGPAAGGLYALWKAGSPDPVELSEALAAAACTEIDLIGQKKAKEGRHRITLGAKARLEAVGLVEGEALDLAFEVLRRHGATNAFGVFGPVQRGLGAGLSGRGWLVDIPGVAGTSNPYDQVWLRDQSLSILRPDARQLPIDQRNGLPARGFLQIVTVSDLAADTQGLTHALAIFGLQQGQRHLGQLQPRPSVSWLLGGGEQPLESGYRWSELSRPNAQVQRR
jgi:thiamine biosynthesis lipoprotein ApbE